MMSWYLALYAIDIEQTNKYPCVRKQIQILQINDIQKSNCPLMNCESQFIQQGVMSLSHVIGALVLAAGMHGHGGGGAKFGS
jgi:hypothetical protein